VREGELDLARRHASRFGARHTVVGGVERRRRHVNIRTGGGRIRQAAARLHEAERMRLVGLEKVGARVLQARLVRRLRPAEPGHAVRALEAKRDGLAGAEVLGAKTEVLNGVRVEESIVNE